MPHVHLPADHSDRDLVLAANLAATIGSEDLYVAWTHEAGAGAIPEIEAEVREERPSTFAAVLGAIFAGVLAAWYGLTHSPAPAAPARSVPPSPQREISS
jgi:hypothetical protein